MKNKTKKLKERGRENRLLVEFENWVVEVEDFRKITDRLRGIYGIHLESIKKNTERDVNM